ncbi:glycosyltransferase family 2 protein [Sphingomonas sp. AX6]|uniref:glycosyltransferase family 2 protein n=1 Tax=Sphingomonas sp. AX6 TaxID=2653171 RepID=UPI0012F175FB|nr:glycosyltransferase family 2 protein [Sphingomonas sp. AX6]VXC98806.1 Glycosyl transferase, group 2 family protein [Sphingomonas sp. AX6]
MTMVAQSPSIDVIIVNYCTGSLVVASLASLEAERLLVPKLRAIVVDNASPDGSGDLIAQAVEARGWDWVKVLRSQRNGGFGAGNNLGINWALERSDAAELYWLLNPDTIVQPCAASALTQFMEAEPLAGIAGSALLEADETPWPFAFRFPTILGEVERAARLGLLSRILKKRAVMRAMGSAPERVDWVSGASFVIRRALLEQGLRFDESFFLYYEETDFCLHAARAGWECWYVPGAVVLHVAGQSTGVTGHQLALKRLPSYWFRSRQYYFLKNHGRVYGMLADIAWMSGHIVAVIKARLRGASSVDPPWLLIDFLRHSAFMPQRLNRDWSATGGA